MAAVYRSAATAAVYASSATATVYSGGAAALVNRSAAAMSVMMSSRNVVLGERNDVAPHVCEYSFRATRVGRGPFGVATTRGAVRTQRYSSDPEETKVVCQSKKS